MHVHGALLEGAQPVLAKESHGVIQSLSLEREGKRVMRQDEMVAAHVRAQIKSGELNPGDKLKTHAAFAEELGVNKNSVFWGFATLRKDGIIIGVQGGRAVVSARAREIVDEGNPGGDEAEEATTEL